MASAPDPTLMRLFGFTLEDLEANRAGKMTANQAARLREGNRSDNQQMGLFLVIMLFTAGMISYGWFASAHKNPTAQPLICIFVGLFIIGLTALVGYHWQKDRKAILVDIENRQMGVASGFLILKDEYRYRQGMVKSAKVDTKTLPLTAAQYDYLKSLSETCGGEQKEDSGWHIMNSIYTTQVRCSVYYAQTSGTMLSMEILE